MLVGLVVIGVAMPAFPLHVILSSLWRMGLASLVMAEVVWIVARAVGANSGPGAVVRVVVSTIVGAVAYVGMLAALQSPELEDVRSRLRPAQSSTVAE